MVTNRADWGWGKKKPVPVFTEDEIQAVMKDHHPYLSVREGMNCSCMIDPTVIRNFNHPVWTPDHFIDKLKEAHYGSKTT